MQEGLSFNLIIFEFPSMLALRLCAHGVHHVAKPVRTRFAGAAVSMFPLHNHAPITRSIVAPPRFIHCSAAVRAKKSKKNKKQRSGSGSGSADAASEHDADAVSFDAIMESLRSETNEAAERFNEDLISLRVGQATPGKT